MTDKITLYRLRGEMPEKKKCDWQGTNATTSEVTGYNQAIDDISSKLEEVEITEAEIKGQIRCIDFSRFENATMSKGKLCEIIAQAIFELLKGGE